jgi:hypothetical protein
VELMGADGARLGGRLPADPVPRGDVRGLVLRSGGYPATGTTGAAYARPCLERLLPIPEDGWRRAPDVYLLLLAPFLGPVAAADRVVGRVRIHGVNSWSLDRLGADRLSADRLAEHLDMDRQKEALLRSRAVELGAEVPEDWLLHSPLHLQSRLSLLRLAPERHPFPQDRRASLARRGVTAALAHSGFSTRKRALFAAWFLLVALAPRSLAVRLIQAGMVRTARPAWLQRFIERGGRSRPRRVVPA